MSLSPSPFRGQHLRPGKAGSAVFHEYSLLSMTAEELQSIISADLPCEHIALEGDGRHWYATIVSAEFAGLRAIQRHQRVYQTLGAKMHTDEMHALSMKTYTPAEWASLPR